jgi:hypothetical protein
MSRKHDEELRRQLRRQFELAREQLAEAPAYMKPAKSNMKHCKGCTHPSICDSHGCGNEAPKLAPNKGGRPPAPPGQRRINVPVRLPEWLIEWMAQQPDTPAALIEAALLKAHKLKPPQ